MFPICRFNALLLVNMFAGSDIYQEMLLKALANYFGAKLLIFDSNSFFGVRYVYVWSVSAFYLICPATGTQTYLVCPGPANYNAFPWQSPVLRKLVVKPDSFDSVKWNTGHLWLSATCQAALLCSLNCTNFFVHLINWLQLSVKDGSPRVFTVLGVL